ncbi:uncharacterized protein LOC143809306 isoform X2 [Ranitomeya variabilis]|uniref:uncharacterized protein LOC143809306 isoform X2 n=1 Tax=Ranitomeya variabilis TaxID=490064 RepID=UPI004056105B
MSAVLEELLGKVRAAALVRGEAWLQEKVAEIVADEGKASDAQDASPCAKRVRSLGPRSPSPVPRNHLKVSSPGRDPPEVAAGQCPSSEVPCPSENPFSLDTDLWNEDLRIPLNAASRHGSDSGLKSEDAGIVSEEEQKSSRDSGQCYSSPSPNPRTDKAETCHSCSNGKDPNMTHSNNTEEEPIELRIERLLQSCSATIMQDQQEEEPSEPTPVSSSVPDLHPCLVWILGDSLVASALEKVSLVPDGRQLGFPLSKAIIQWLGFSSLTWDSVTPTVTRYSCLDRPPDILVIHAGGDDLYSGVSIMDLIGNIKFDIFKLKSLFPGVEIVWSQIVKRYKCPQAKNHKPFKFACKKINKQLTNYQRCKKTKWAVVVRHMDLEGDVAHLFEKDGAHLNSAGNKIWCRDIQEGIEKALQRWHHPGNSQG